MYGKLNVAYKDERCSKPVDALLGEVLYCCFAPGVHLAIPAYVQVTRQTRQFKCYRHCVCQSAAAH